MRTEEAIKDTILGIIHRELTDTVRLDKQVKIRDRVFEMLSEEGNLIIPHVVNCECDTDNYTKIVTKSGIVVYKCHTCGGCI